MRRFGLGWLGVAAGVSACMMLSGCGRESGSGGGPVPTSAPVERSRVPQAKTSFDVGEAEAAEYKTVAADVETPTALGLEAESPAPGSEPPSTADDYAAAREDRSPPERARRDPGPDPPRVRRSRIQSGTLTAGSFDDHARFDDYRRYLSEAMQGDAREMLPRLAVGTRVMIEVSDSRGEPVGDARVVVRAANAGQRTAGDGDGPALLDLATGSDGRTILLTGMDGAAHDGEYLVTVYPPDEDEPITRRMQIDQGPWRIALPDVRARLPRKLDLALVVDTTGSMGDELDYLRVEIDSIAKTVYRMFPDVDQRYALIVYRDDGDQYVTRTFDFTSSLEAFRVTLSEQSANGGGNYPEAMHLALESAGDLDWRGRDTARVLFLVADAPPHDRFAGRTLDAVERLRRRGVRMFPVAASGVAAKAEFVMRAAGFLTLGQYLFLTDHSGVGNPHARPHVPDYQVERLDRLMIRMVASELAGRRLAAEEVLAIERGDGTLPRLDEGPVPPGQQRRARAAAPRRASVPFSFDGFPRWLILLGAVVGLCLVDSLLGRGQG